MFVVALKTRYHLYVALNDDNNGMLVPIEQISMDGQHIKLVLFNHVGNLYCVIGSYFENHNTPRFNINQ